MHGGETRTQTAALAASFLRGCGTLHQEPLRNGSSAYQHPLRRVSAPRVTTPSFAWRAQEPLDGGTTAASPSSSCPSSMPAGGDVGESSRKKRNKRRREETAAELAGGSLARWSARQ